MHRAEFEGKLGVEFEGVTSISVVFTQNTFLSEINNSEI